MRIIVIGAGKVGYTLAEHLIAEEHDVIIIDKDDDVIERCSGSLDALCIRGNGANAKILLEAGVEKANIVIASTESDFGDPIVLNKEKIELKRGSYSPEISVVANGVFLMRFDDQGELDAVVASEVKSLTVGELSFVLSDDEIGADPVDIAVWKDANGQWRGVFQRHDNVLPPTLQKIVPTWNYLQRR